MYQFKAISQEGDIYTVEYLGYFVELHDETTHTATECDLTKINDGYTITFNGSTIGYIETEESIACMLSEKIKEAQTIIDSNYTREDQLYLAIRVLKQLADAGAIVDAEFNAMYTLVNGVSVELETNGHNADFTAFY